MHLADGEHQRLAGIRLPGVDGLQRQMDVRHDVQGVHAVVGLGAVRSLSLDADGEPVHCGKTGSCNVSACAKPMCSLFLALERAPGGKRTQVLLVDEELGY